MTPANPKRHNKRMTVTDKVIAARCLCGCGQLTRTGNYCRGHELQLQYQLVSAVIKGKRAQTIIEAYGWQHLVDEMQEKMDAKVKSRPDKFRDIL